MIECDIKIIVINRLIISGSIKKYKLVEILNEKEKFQFQMSFLSVKTFEY